MISQFNIEIFCFLIKIIALITANAVLFSICKDYLQDIKNNRNSKYTTLK